MANKKDSGKKASGKPTMRELAASKNTKNKRSLKVKSSGLGRHFKKVLPKKRRLVKLPDNKLGRGLDKLLFTLPRYFKGAWSEIKKTTWPNRKETMRLTFAVFVFSTVFAVFVSLLDFGLDKLFKHLITK